MKEDLSWVKEFDESIKPCSNPDSPEGGQQPSSDELLLAFSEMHDLDRGNVANGMSYAERTERLGMYVKKRPLCFSTPLKSCWRFFVDTCAKLQKDAAFADSMRSVLADAEFAHAHPVSHTILKKAIDDVGASCHRATGGPSRNGMFKRKVLLVSGGLFRILLALLFALLLGVVCAVVKPVIMEHVSANCTRPLAMWVWINGFLKCCFLYVLLKILGRGVSNAWGMFFGATFAMSVGADLLALQNFLLSTFEAQSDDWSATFSLFALAAFFFPGLFLYAYRYKGERRWCLVARHALFAFSTAYALFMVLGAIGFNQRQGSHVWEKLRRAYEAVVGKDESIVKAEDRWLDMAIGKMLARTIAPALESNRNVMNENVRDFAEGHSRLSVADVIYDSGNEITPEVMPTTGLTNEELFVLTKFERNEFTPEKYSDYQSTYVRRAGNKYLGEQERGDDGDWLMVGRKKADYYGRDNGITYRNGDLKWQAKVEQLRFDLQTKSRFVDAIIKALKDGRGVDASDNALFAIMQDEMSARVLGVDYGDWAGKNKCERFGVLSKSEYFKDEMNGAARTAEIGIGARVKASDAASDGISDAANQVLEDFNKRVASLCAGHGVMASYYLSTYIRTDAAFDYLWRVRSCKGSEARDLEVAEVEYLRDFITPEDLACDGVYEIRNPHLEKIVRANRIIDLAYDRRSTGCLRFKEVFVDEPCALASMLRLLWLDESCDSDNVRILQSIIHDEVRRLYSPEPFQRRAFLWKCADSAMGVVFLGEKILIPVPKEDEWMNDELRRILCEPVVKHHLMGGPEIRSAGTDPLKAVLFRLFAGSVPD